MNDVCKPLSGVGTLLYSELASVPIDRNYDQGPGGGGYSFELGFNNLSPNGGWTHMERLPG
jgi:hypothetical protein